MAVHSLCYDTLDSKIFNLFHHSYGYQDGFNYRNVLIFVRILQSLAAAAGVGKKRDVVELLGSVGYAEAAIHDALQKLFEASLLESVDGSDEADVTDIMLSVKGKMYLDELAKEYVYLLFVSDAVPMEDQYKIGIDSKFGTEEYVVSRGNLLLKNDSVMKFIGFIAVNEGQEKEACSPDCLGVLDRLRGGMALADKVRSHVRETIAIMIKSGVRHRAKRASGFRLDRGG